MLGQDFSLIGMLMPTDEAFYLTPALERLKTETEDKACASLLKLLWYTVTAESDGAIAAVAKDATRSAAVRKAAGDLVAQSLLLSTKVKGDKRAKAVAAVGVSVDATIPELKAARRKRMQGNISDESLGDLDQFTLLIRSRAR